MGFKRKNGKQIIKKIKEMKNKNKRQINKNTDYFTFRFRFPCSEKNAMIGLKIITLLFVFRFHAP